MSATWPASPPPTGEGLPLVEAVASCPLCAAPGPFRLAFPPHVSRCPACGVHFMSPRPTQLDIGRHYDSGVTYRQWQAERAARDQMWHRRLRLVQRIAPGGRLLDIGTGDGHFMDVAKAAGYAVMATEVSAAGTREARARGHDVVTGQLAALALPDASYDLVTMWHVLEHVPDPGAVLKRVFRLLRPGGTLIVAVPNEEKNLLRHAMWTGARSPFGDGTFGPGEEIHLTFFRPATLKRALEGAGLVVRGFGVDNVYLQMTPGRRLKLGVHRVTSLVSGWHTGIAMYAAARRP